MTIRVVIADDHRLLLEGLTRALDGIPDIEVVGTVEEGAHLPALLSEVSPDVMLLDIEMPGVGGLAALGSLTDPPPTIVVTMHTDTGYRQNAAMVGAAGFLSKATPLPRLAAAIRAVHAGKWVLDAEETETILANYMEPVLDQAAASLTNRERELLAQLATGVSTTGDLADSLFISQKTVKNHLAAIYQKLGISNRTQAAVEAIRLGFTQPPTG